VVGIKINACGDNNLRWNIMTLISGVK